ncbi:MAG: methionyl-tRNA formyltransferase [Gammaproteobacteria bacterium]|nr:methionyl-tRNA formyltransferase [Gammaproteobacteria bacterium]MBT8150144.1 methionyl-tRNA formyltransferase [Gammaproteobacteria bacterium]NND40258.1 methionyl-tRNA formyltransferase [Pseudomonadales bacterium]NNL10972.1 methionyl-tRNA formyltransferase [Pseudomonadales bacterium]RZV56521.1 MAG: methionyl-tRNA formyltransferase [Pseudomonadales bacterium]
MILRILFAGTPEFAAAHLRALYASAEHELLAVYTQPDRRAGRGKKLLASPVKQFAEQAGINVEQPVTLKTPEAQQQLAAYNADLLVVVAYGLLLPKAVLDAPARGCVNVHASLLPRWRGAAPVERAIEAGDTESGVTIMQMDEGLDTGPMLLRESFALASDETGDSLRQRLVACGTGALLKVLRQIAQGRAAQQLQDDSEACYANKLDKREAALDFGMPAVALECKIRAFTSALPCYAVFKQQRIKIISASVQHREPGGAARLPGEILSVDKTQMLVACGEGILAVHQLQLPGGKTMTLQALHNGRPDFFRAGDSFARAL